MRMGIIAIRPSSISTRRNLGYVGDINLLNFTAGVKWRNYKVGLYLKNALDEQTPDLPNTATELNGSFSYIAELPPRRNFGIQASVKY